MMSEILLLAAGIYLMCGLGLAVPFALVGVGKVDPHAERASWGFRVLIIPGTLFLWPLLARRWMKGVHEPPEENNPHRRAARNFGSTGRGEVQGGPVTSPQLSPLPPGAERGTNGAP